MTKKKPPPPPPEQDSRNKQQKQKKKKNNGDQGSRRLSESIEFVPAAATAADIVDELILEKGAMNISPPLPPPPPTPTEETATAAVGAAAAAASASNPGGTNINATGSGFLRTEDMERQLLEKNMIVANNGSLVGEHPRRHATTLPGAMSCNAVRYAKSSDSLGNYSNSPTDASGVVVAGTNDSSTPNNTTNSLASIHIGGGRRHYGSVIGAIPMSGINSSTTNATTNSLTTDLEAVSHRDEDDTDTGVAGGENIDNDTLGLSSSHNNNDNNDGGGGGQLLSAMLVEEEDVVEAKMAPEGFEALVRNNRFKHLVVIICLILLAIIIPVAVLVRRSNQQSSSNVFQSNSTEGEIDIFTTCGSAVANQQDYRGFQNVTTAGVPCQHWASQSPRSHRYFPERFPGADLSENYCRNPDGRGRAWCFMSTSGMFAYCDVPFCGGDTPINNLVCGSLSAQQNDYRGTINRTNSGRQCQRWDSQEPHSHARIPELFLDEGLEANYCRNPDGEGMAWCYTTDRNVRWEFCTVPICEVMYFNGSLTGVEDDQRPEAEEFNTETCGSVNLLQSDYRGTINVTRSGRTCQRWDKQKPHNHYNTPEAVPSMGLEENYCRNPDGEKGAWCYTLDKSQRWELCNVPTCPLHDLEQCGTYDWKQRDYRGKMNVTKSGIACQPWAEQTPHFHFELPELMPEDGLISNFCRNPTDDERAWCYTSSPEVVWEYCDVDFCTSEEERQKSLVCGSRDKYQSDYRGTISVTESGHRCQAWNKDFPHAHDYILLLPEQEAILQKNYCRNPDGKGRAWCFPTAVINRTDYFEYCDVPYCEDLKEEDHQDEEEEQAYFCSNCTLLQCGSPPDQSDYRGKINVTKEGIPCQAWTVQEPHKHNRTPEEYPDASLSENYCRNPDGKARAWCYTSDPEKRWSFCNVPTCS